MQSVSAARLEVARGGGGASHWPEGSVRGNFPVQNADTSQPPILPGPLLTISFAVDVREKSRREGGWGGEGVGGAGAKTNKEFKCETIKNKIK